MPQLWLEPSFSSTTPTIPKRILICGTIENQIFLNGATSTLGGCTGLNWVAENIVIKWSKHSSFYQGPVLPPRTDIHWSPMYSSIEYI